MHRHAKYENNNMSKGNKVWSRRVSELFELVKTYPPVNIQRSYGKK